MKYVRVSGSAIGDDAIVLFPNHVDHATMVNLLQANEADSAGFVDFDRAGDPVAYGKSIGLKVASKPEDTGMIRRMVRTY